MHMKLAVQESMLPGESLADRVALAADLGFEGMEIWGDAIIERVEEIRSAFKGRSILPATICAGYSGALVTADPALRKQCREGILDRLRVAADLGMVGLIVVPAFNHQQNLPDLSPGKTARELGEDLLIAQLEQMAPQIEKLGGPCILLEALNRYEAGFMCRQSQAADVARRVNSPAVKVMCDLFHMNIEEPDTPAALREVGPLCRHVHLADNTRSEPGSGCLDFRAAFAALKDSGFTGYMALECGLSGEPKKTLTDTVAFLRSCM